MNPTQIRYTYFPLTEPPAFFAEQIVNVFKKHEPTISTVTQNAHDSNEVLAVVADDLSGIGFDVEGEKGKIKRPVFYGENGLPTKAYNIDAFHREWKCALEIEMARAIGGNAVYRDLIQALIMVDVQCLVLGVPLYYRRGSRTETPYSDTRKIAEAVYAHSRITMPYKLLLVGF
jgi:hypothetical protein